MVTSSEEVTGGVDVARLEGLNRLFDPYCGHVDAFTAGVGIVDRRGNSRRTRRDTGDGGLVAVKGVTAMGAQ